MNLSDLFKKKSLLNDNEYIRLFYEKYLYTSIAEILCCGLFHLKHIYTRLYNRQEVHSDSRNLGGQNAILFGKTTGFHTF